MSDEEDANSTTNLQPLVEPTPPKLTDLLNVNTLQRIQDLFVNLTGITTVIRDEKGALITRPSMMNDLCAMIAKSEKGGKLCEESNRRVLKRLRARGDEPVQYVCHAGMLHYMAPICVMGRCLGTIVMGDMRRRPFTEAEIRELALRLDLDEAELQKAARRVPQWRKEHVEHSVRFLQNLANVLAGFCYQGFQLRERLNELTILYNFTKLLNSTLRLEDVLRLSIENVVAALNVKACSLRLLDPKGEELVVKSYFNLSKAYLNKGPVRLAESEIDREAMAGKVVYIEDLQNDPRVLYPKEAKKEGLRTGLSVGLICKGKAIGTIHIYAGEARRFTEEELRIFRALANQAAIAIETARLNEATLEKERLDRELALAQDIQNRLLPAHPPKIPETDIAVRTLPSRFVGGDFYDMIPLENGLFVITVADVSGKGVPGAILMATARALLRSYPGGTGPPSDVLKWLNTCLCRDTRTSEFVSIFYAIFHPHELKLQYSNGGHNPPFILRGEKTIRLERGGMIVGSIEDVDFEDEIVQLRPGDILVMYTDGITEMMNESGEVFGEKRVIDIVRSMMNDPAEQIVAAVLDAADTFRGDAPQRDDMTLLVVKII